MSEQKEPSIHGGIGGPHPNWLLWYRKTHGCTLAEARAAGFKKLENPDVPKPQVSAEPSLTYPDGSGPTVAWVKWYQSENNCSLKPAVEAARAKMKGE